MDDDIAEMIAEYALMYSSSGEEGKYWCKNIIRDLAGVLCGEFMEVYVEGDDDSAR